MSAPYYNSTQLSGPALADTLVTTKNQDEVILVILKATLRYEGITPWELLHVCQEHGRDYLITSVRRSLHTHCHTFHNLIEDGQRLWLKTGRPETVYKLCPVKYPAPAQQIKMF